MKLSRYISKLLWAVPALMLAGCSDDNEPSATGADMDVDAPSELTLTLSVPDHEVVNIGSRAGGDPTIKSVTVFCYDQTGTAGNYLQHTTLTSGWETAGSGYKITVPIHKRTKSVHLVVNANISDTDTNPTDILSSDVNGGIMWGRKDLKDIIAKGSSITMVRNTAKVSVNNGAKNFTFSQFTVTGTSDKGTVAPTGWNLQPTTPTIPDGAVSSTAATLQSASSEIRVFETMADDKKPGTNFEYITRSRIIIEGTYNGVKGYYTVAFRERSGYSGSEIPDNYHYSPLHILRNHHYIVNIKEVRAQGYATIEEAKNAEPDNRIAVYITDKTPEITDIIADRDYMLGVGDDVDVTWDANMAQITVATSWTGTHASNGKPYEISVAGSSMSWVTVNGITEASKTIQDYGTAGAKVTTYVLNVPITQNENSNITRTAELTVRSGDLTRTVKINQAGRNYKRDDNRAVILEGLPGGTISNWFKFVDEQCKGLRPEDSYSGLERNQGLIFPAVPAYTLTYRIPKLAGDRNPKVSGNFTYSENGGTYTITANSTSSPHIEIGEFTVVNSYGATIHYPLYQTGYLHQLTSSTNKYQREEEKINGWFYYEVVRVGSSYILDRNLGASSNKPYISTYAGFKNNADAIGAYFKISTQKSSSYNDPKTIIPSLGVSNFQIPTEDQVTSWGVKSANTSNTSGELSLVATVNTSAGQYAQVYIPHGGYYEATSPKYETHANIWTRTLLSGTQGFGTNSPEFGYWYRYLDVYGSKVTFSNMRIANRAASLELTDQSVYKYMPIRLIWQ